MDELLGRAPVFVATEGILGALTMIRDARNTLTRVIEDGRNGLIGPFVDRRNLAIAATHIEDAVYRLHSAILNAQEH